MPPIPTSTLPTKPSLTALLRLALPLSGAMLSQALLGLVDTALVGHLGGLALASVSIGSYLVFILAALLTGFGTGLHTYVSQSKIASTWLSSGLWFGLSLAIVLSAIAALVAPEVITAFVLDDRINSLALHYTQWRLWGLPAIVLSISMRVYWSHQGQPWQFAKILLLAHVANVPISYALIYGIGVPAMGASGAALGTSIALWLGAFMQWLHFVRAHGSVPLRAPKVDQIRQLIYLGWPSMVQQLAFSMHLAVFMWIVSHLGASALAATFSVLNVGLLLVLPAVGLGQATLSLIGKAIAQQDATRIKQWSRLILITGLLSSVMLLVLVWLGREPLANLLLVSRELQNLTSTALPWYALAMVLETLIIILSRCLIVAGPRKRPFIWVGLGQWGLFLPLMIWCIPSYGFIMVWWLHIGYRAIVSGILWLSWQHYLQQRKTQGQAS
mgnify:FL=1